jgi:1-acyl-sn-glycerol-3-phosphate acyltransferase
MARLSPRGASPALSTDEARLLAVVDKLARELNPGRKHVNASLDSALDRDLGFDSLGRAELLVRAEREFGVTLPERLLGESETPRDLLGAAAARKTSAALSRTEARAAPALRPAAAEPTGARTLCEVLDRHVAAEPDRVHILLEEAGEPKSTLSVGALRRKARHAAGRLRQRQVAPGDRVAIMLPTGEDFFIAFFAALYAGAVPVPIYPPVRAAQLEDHLRRQAGVLGHAGATVLIAPQEMRPAATLLRSLVESIAAVITVPALLETGDDAGELPEQGAELALLQYTSGSTGAPKGVALTHANLLANIRAMGAVMEASSADTFVSWLPLYHDMGLIGAWLGSLYYGAKLVVMPPQSFLVRPERWLWAIHRHRGTLSAAPNFAFELCLGRIEDSAIAGLDLSPLRMVANGAEPVSAATIARFEARFGRYGFRGDAMAPVYGLAENAVGLAFPPPGRAPIVDRISRSALTRSGRAEPASAAEPAVELVACGRPLPGHEIRVVDDTGREPGERYEGRLQFRGPSATRGYFRDEKKTRELFSDHWLESGDLAYVANGDVFITGRSKDIVIRAGRHIYPSEIEEAVGQVEGVRKGGVAAFGTVDARTGTERLVVLAETRVFDEAPRAALRARIVAATNDILEAPPDEVVLVPPRTVPKTSSGKLRRATARQLYESSELGTAAHPLWRQVLTLAAMSVWPRARRTFHASGAFLFAAYWWAALALVAPIAWCLVVTLPRPSWRWATMRLAGRLLFRMTGIGLLVERRREPPAGSIIVCNHASYLDGLVLVMGLGGELSFVAKGELVRQPVARLALTALGTLFVSRSDPEQGIEDLARATGAARSGRRIVFFPEGTLTRVPGLMPFKLGAFAAAARCGLPVVPVAIRGTRSVLRGGQWFPRKGVIVLAMGDPCRATGASLGDAARLRDEARAAVRAMCGEPDLVELG